MAGDAPAISVVTATYNRAKLLPRLLAALERQDVAEPYEVIVVDDSSGDDTWQVLKSAAANSTMPLRVLQTPVNSGPAVARNMGWRAAKAPRIAFTDDDCVPQPSWLRTLVAALDDADLVQGMTLPNPDEAHLLGPFSHTISVTTENGHYETCNIGYRREVLEAADGFAESFRYPYGEDVDLALRAKSDGARSAFEPAAVVHHDVSPSKFRAYLKLRRTRKAFVLLCRQHREMRSELTFGVFSNLTALTLAGAMILVVLRPRSWLPWLLTAVLGAKYARKIVTSVPPPQGGGGWFAVVPLRLLADLIELGICARASVRYRTIVL